MSDENRRDDELNHFVDDSLAGRHPSPSSAEAELAADLLNLAHRLEPDVAFVARLGAQLKSIPSAEPTDKVIEEQPVMTVRQLDHNPVLPVTLLAALVTLAIVTVLMLRAWQPTPSLGGAVAQTVSPTPEPSLPIPVGAHANVTNPDLVGRMREMGMTWAVHTIHVRLDENNPAVETMDAQVALENAQSAIAAAHEQGLKLLLQIGGQREDITSLGGDFDAAYAAFIGQIAALNPDAIQIWIEPNLDLHWPTGEIDPAAYTALLKASYEAIKAANPDVKVISAAPAPTSSQSGFPERVMNDDVFYQGMADAGAAAYMDCIGVNYVEGVVPPDQTSGDPRDDVGTRYLVPMLQRAAGPFRAENLPVCIVELGYFSAEGLGDVSLMFDWAQDTDNSEQAAWLRDAVQIAASLSSIRVEMVMIFHIDTQPIADIVMAGYSIIRPDESCPACEAIASLKQ